MSEKYIYGGGFLWHMLNKYFPKYLASAIYWFLFFIGCMLYVVGD
jgi:hypothetical protein